jgi:hypothetical protein
MSMLFRRLHCLWYSPLRILGLCLERILQIECERVLLSCRKQRPAMVHYYR